jgi:hypothetical protein
VIVNVREHVVAYHIYLIRANGEVDRNSEENKQNERTIKREAKKRVEKKIRKRKIYVVDNMDLLARTYKVTLSVTRVFVNRFVILLGFMSFYFCEGLINKSYMCLTQLIS